VTQSRTMVCQGRKMLDDSKSGPAAGLCYRVIGHVAGAELRVCRVIPGAGMHNSLVLKTLHLFLLTTHPFLRFPPLFRSVSAMTSTS
jgi:hypothetical protein